MLWLWWVLWVRTRRDFFLLCPSPPILPPQGVYSGWKQHYPWTPHSPGGEWRPAACWGPSSRSRRTWGSSWLSGRGHSSWRHWAPHRRYSSPARSGPSGFWGHPTPYLLHCRASKAGMHQGFSQRTLVSDTALAPGGSQGATWRPKLKKYTEGLPWWRSG